MKTSVVVATFNGEKYISQQLQSILDQTVKCDEVIIGDDCSSDNTVRIIESFINNNSLFPSWKLIRNKNNKGFIKNFHDLICEATGEIIFLADQDDLWKEDKVECIKNIFIKDKNHTILSLNTGFRVIDQNGDLINHQQKNANNGQINCIMENKEIKQCSLKIYRRDVRWLYEKKWLNCIENMQL